MQLQSPIQITPRLLPGVEIGGVWISIEWSDRPGDEYRCRFQYHIDGPAWSHSVDDLQSGNVRDVTLQSGLESLLSFLGACGESWDSDPEDRGDQSDLFPTDVAEWASENQDELSDFAFQLEENPNLITN